MLGAVSVKRSGDESFLFGETGTDQAWNKNPSLFETFMKASTFSVMSDIVRHDVLGVLKESQNRRSQGEPPNARQLRVFRAALRRAALAERRA